MPIHTKNWYSCPPYSWWGGHSETPMGVRNHGQPRGPCMLCVLYLHTYGGVHFVNEAQ